MNLCINIILTIIDGNSCTTARDISGINEYYSFVSYEISEINEK